MAEFGTAGEIQKLDALVLGAGPFSLLEAAHLAREGRNVAVVESGSRLGGAWASASWAGYENVDLGCHVIEPDEASYAFLADQLGCNLVPQDPQPQCRWRGRDFKCGSQLPKHLGLVQKALGRPSDLARAGRGLLYAIRHDWGRRKDTYLYPKRGCAELIEALGRALEAHGVPVYFDEELVAVELDADRRHCRASCESGRRFECEALVLSNASRLSTVSVGGQPVGLGHPTPPANHCHVHLLMDAPGRKPFSYVKFVGHPDLDRISDLTSYVTPNGPDAIGNLLICVQLHSPLPAAADEAREARRVMTMLAEEGALSAEAQLLGARWSVYHHSSFSRSAVEVEALERRLGPAVRVLQTKALSPHLHLHTPRWKATDFRAHVSRGAA